MAARVVNRRRTITDIIIIILIPQCAINESKLTSWPVGRVDRTDCRKCRDMLVFLSVERNVRNPLDSSVVDVFGSIEKGPKHN